MTGPLSAIYGLLKHPLTDIGLAQFVADFEKEISNYFILKQKRPFRLNGSFYFNVPKRRTKTDRTDNFLVTV
jgi:hypothetical protein